MNDNFASPPLTSSSLFNSSSLYGYYPGADPISPLEARFPNPSNIGSAPRPQQIGPEAGPSYSLSYPVSRSEAENQFALQQAQAECTRLKQQLVLFETQKLEQQNVEKYSSTGAKKKRQPNASRHLAQGFTFSTNFWTVEKASVLVATVIPPDFDPLTRQTMVPPTPPLVRKHALHCFLWELNEYLPDEHKHIMKSVAEMEKFLSYAQTLRSELQNHVRSNAAILLAEFEGVTKEDCAEATDPDARATNSLFRQLLSYNAAPTSTRPQYPGLCPIISSDDAEFPFGTENIVKFLIIILFGKSQARAEIPERHKGCNADNWGITEITPNMVAVAATMIRYLVSPDRTFTAVGTTSKIDWIAACLGYKTLIITNRETPGIISLFEKLNSRLFGGRVAPVQQAPSPIPDDVDPTPFDTSMQSAIASLQSRLAVSPVQDFTHTHRLTPTPSLGMNTVVQRSSSAQPTTIEDFSPTEDQESAAHAENLIRMALNADSETSNDEEDSGDKNGGLESLSVSSTVQLSRRTNNLDILATAASTAPLPPAPSPPVAPVPALSSPSNASTATSTASRASKRKAVPPDYTDLDENGDADPPTPRKRRAVNNGASNGKGAKKAKARSGEGSGSNPAARAQPKRTNTAPTK